MSSAALANTLVSLLPTYTTSTIPQPLLDTAVALLAQSRSRAATLKSEEEPARAWACAEIAIKRLQTRLNLPTATQNPPCPPRVYKKLLQFLDRTLVATAPASNAASEPSTPRKSRAAADDQANTPTKTQTTQVRQFKADTAASAPTNKRKADTEEQSDNDTPSWLASTIKHLCKKLLAPDAIPHVYVGVVTILRERLEDHRGALRSAKRSRTLMANPSTITSPSQAQLPEAEILAIVVAVLHLVLDRMQLALHLESFSLQSRVLVQELVALGRVNVATSGAVIVASKRIVEEDAKYWTSMDWWHGVPNGGNDAQTGDEDEDGGMRHESAGKSSNRVASELLLSGRGLGAIDWLSEDKRQDYREWEADVLRRIEQMRRTQDDRVG